MSCLGRSKVEGFHNDGHHHYPSGNEVSPIPPNGKRQENHRPKYALGKAYDAVDGRNPAPPGMYKTLKIMGSTTYQLVQDFSHQQYDMLVARRVTVPIPANLLFFPFSRLKCFLKVGFRWESDTVDQCHISCPFMPCMLLDHLCVLKAKDSSSSWRRWFYLWVIHLQFRTRLTGVILGKDKGNKKNLQFFTFCCFFPEVRT